MFTVGGVQARYRTGPFHPSDELAAKRSEILDLIRRGARGRARRRSEGRGDQT